MYEYQLKRLARTPEKVAADAVFQALAKVQLAVGHTAPYVVLMAKARLLDMRLHRT